MTSIPAVRRFNRFYTRIIGTLNENLLESSLSLAEARVLYELAHRNQPTASEIAAELGMDMSYLSRILSGFTAAKLIRRQISDSDRRQSTITLTAAGQQEFDFLDRRSSEQVREMLSALTPEQQSKLVCAMTTIESLLSDQPETGHLILRQHRPGDMGWVVERHGALYALEYGWDERFEALVARITADFIDHLDPTRERCWIAERDGRRLGCVFLVRDTESPDPSQTARLRLLLVDPAARGLGLGRTLVRECTAFARTAGYRRIVLWTNSVLTSARRIYEQEGYHLVREKPYTAFGKNLVSQDWQLDLQQDWQLDSQLSSQLNSQLNS
jgi:DNA-binding MarR family transcriptional regulator/GNAT superfamily N-acetyltransferase